MSTLGLMPYYRCILHLNRVAGLGFLAHLHLIANLLNIGSGGPGLLQNLAQERDLTGEAAFFDEAVGPQRRHQLFLSHQMAGVAHQQQQSLEGFGWKGQNLVAAAQNAFAGHEPELAEGISLRLRRLGTGFGTCRDRD